MALCKAGRLRALVPDGGRLMGLDVGRKTIGIATGDAGWRVATPHSVLRRGKFARDMEALAALADGAGVGGLVIGWPVMMDGSEGPRCDATRDFAHALLRDWQGRGRPDLPVAFRDERLSSAAVERAMLEGDLSRRKRGARRDALAAAWILQGFLESAGDSAADAAGDAAGDAASAIRRTRT